MEIIKTNEISQLNISSRAFDTGQNVDVLIIKESLRTPVTISVPATYASGVISFDYDFEASDGDFFFVVVSQFETILCKSKVFCTDQTDLQNYQITKGEYIQPTDNDNTYIKLWVRHKKQNSPRNNKSKSLF